ncbi:M14 family metallopeptidase [Haloglomus halophilum]|uniref:M14 family metallopeptidase n=1 Tax=Haloglomus halophilum TaxID=2962672 RepID=UPI0020C954AF|nr:M14 family metallopeptidase [Haloglomus halophilum]
MSEHSFTDADISRRRFVQLSAATGAALALPGNATADASADAFDAEYQYVQNHTPADYAVPTAIETSDAAALSAITGIAPDARTTTDPAPAAYATLTTEQAQAVADLPTAKDIHFAPGGNPFWRLGFYPLGVFPDPTRCVDYLDIEEVGAGFEHLADEHADRMRVFGIGQSAGKYNDLSARRDPRDVMVVEVTENVGDRAAFSEKRQVLVNCTIHGNERAGGEAAPRFIERLLTGNERDIERLLDDYALVFTFTNPDGWAARRPQYESNGVPNAPLHERGNLGGDTNRQYPNPGWVSAAHTIAEPQGRTLDGTTDPPDYVADTVPDTLAFIEHCRTYENLVSAIDLHGMLSSKDFVLALDGASQSDTGALQNSFELIERIGENITAALPEWETAGQTISDVTGGTNPSYAGLSVVPEQAFNAGTPVETIGYSGTGFVDEWMSFPERLGGLDVPSLTMEMAYSNTVGGNAYDPARVGMQVDGYQAAIRGAVEYATREVEGRFESDGDIAFVDTDDLRRSSGDLDFGDGGGDSGDGGDDGNTSSTATASPAATTTEEATLPAGGATTQTYTVDPATTRFMVYPHVHESVASAELVAPDGTAVRTFDATEGRALGGACCALPTWEVTDPQAGDWTVRFTDELESGSSVQTQFAATQGSVDAPDPVAELGYEQRDYEVDPLRYFRDLDDDATDEVDGLAVDTIAGDDDGSEGQGPPPRVVEMLGEDPTRSDETDPLAAYDHVVASHDDGIENADYVAAIEEFVSDGGNLVLTDSGLHLLAAMDGVAIESGDITTTENNYVAQLDTVNDHPLVTDRDPIQDHLWYIAPLGYAENEAPVTSIDQASFEDAGGSVAGLTGGRAVVGTLDVGDGTIQVVGSLLPPAKQTNLHPFGMVDYAATYFGHLVMTNALFGQQVREVDGEETLRIGRGSGDSA